MREKTLFQLGACVHYVVVDLPKIQWKPFWHAIQLSLSLYRMNGLGSNFGESLFDVFTHALLIEEEHT